MSTHDYALDNGSGLAVRTDLNNALLAIVSKNSSATAPSTTYAYMWWADTTTGLLKIRNAANSAWVTVGTLASAYLGAMPTTGGTFSAAIDFSNTDYMKIPVGTTAQRPASPASGHIRYNTDLKTMEIYEESVWINLGDKINVVTKTANYTLLNSDSVVLGDATSGTFTLTLPTAVGIAGKKFILKKIDSSTNAVSIATTSSQTIDGITSRSLLRNNDCIQIYSDGANYKVCSDVYTNYKESSSSGTYSNATTTFTDVTNLSVTITTHGRPVLVAVVGTGTLGGLYVQNTSSSGNTAAAGEMKILRDSTDISYQSIQCIDSSSTNGADPQLYVPSGMLVIDFPAAGTYTYKMQARAASSDNVKVTQMKLVAVEL